jgi:CheY-like chemotaxis protein
LRRLREDPATRRIPVIMISADAMPAQVNRLLQAGVCAYLTKPLDIKKFLDHVKQILSDGTPSPAGQPH